jgi:transcriptional regulator with PAS, ATPase and Fis domain
LDRFQLFHQIITESDSTSADSVLEQTTVVLLNATGSRRGAWFYGVANDLVCRASVSTDPQDSFDGSRHLPKRTIQNVLLNGEWSCTKITPTTGSYRHSYLLCIPTELGKDARGVLCLERVGSDNFFFDGEVEVLRQVVEDVTAIIGSSASFERQAFELDKAKSRLAMNQVGLISNHPSMLKLFDLIRKLARVPSTVLIHGESGTGKELVARAIYKLGTYKGPFIGINCGGIEPNLMKSELFGYVKGSFTGAEKTREGFFKKARDGVLFLDEIGEMPMDMQVALLRTLERNEIIPVGGEVPEKVNTRVVCATHRDLAKMVEEGTFRNDLYQRIRGLILQVPPLRERLTDLEQLCTHFIDKYNSRLGSSFKGLKPEAVEMLKSLDYREGNIRELEHIIERAMVFEDDPHWIGTQYLTDQTDADAEMVDDSFKTFEEAMNQYAAQLIRNALEECQGNKSKAMKHLGLSRSTFYSHLNKLKIK